MRGWPPGPALPAPAGGGWRRRFPRPRAPEAGRVVRGCLRLDIQWHRINIQQILAIYLFVTILSSTATKEEEECIGGGGVSRWGGV